MAVLDAAAVVGATLDTAASSDLAAASWKRAINLPWLVRRPNASLSI